MKKYGYLILSYLLPSLLEAAYNPPTAPHVEHGANLFFTGDFLYWKANVEDIHYVAKVQQSQPNQFVLSSLDGKVISPELGWDPGFRVGVGWNLPYDGWDLYVQWTRLYSTARDEQCSAPCPMPTGADLCCDCEELCPNCNPCVEICNLFRNSCCKPSDCFNLLIPTFSPRVSQNQYLDVLKAKAKYRLRINLLDPELGREYQVSSFLDLRPFIGLRGAWISQKYQIKYLGRVSLDSPETIAVKIDIDGLAASNTRIQNLFEGVGPRAGLNRVWNLGQGFSLYGDGAISLLFGEFTLKSNSCLYLDGGLKIGDAILPIDTFKECGVSNLADEFHTTKASTDLALGVQWERKLLDQRMRILLKLGWDFHLFFEQNQILFLQDLGSPLAVSPAFVPGLPPTQNFSRAKALVKARRSGDLTMQGLTLSARLDF